MYKNSGGMYEKQNLLFQVAAFFGKHFALALGQSGDRKKIIYQVFYDNKGCRTRRQPLFANIYILKMLFDCTQHKFMASMRRILI